MLWAYHVLIFLGCILKQLSGSIQVDSLGRIFFTFWQNIYFKQIIIAIKCVIGFYKIKKIYATKLGVNDNFFHFYHFHIITVMT